MIDSRGKDRSRGVVLDPAATARSVYEWRRSRQAAGQPGVDEDQYPGEREANTGRAEARGRCTFGHTVSITAKRKCSRFARNARDAGISSANRGKFATTGQARREGLDFRGVQIHAAHGYLVASLVAAIDNNER